MVTGTGSSDEVERFWDLACHHTRLTSLPGYLPPSSRALLAPPAWAFGRTPEQADSLLALVLDGTKTATASALADYEAEDEPLPQVGALGIVTDGAGHPRALIETTSVEVVAFDDVLAEHAHLEGEGDRSLAHWRAVHADFFAGGSGLDPAMPVVLERFRLLYDA